VSPVPAAAVPPARQGRPVRPERQARPRLSADLLANLTARLTSRDRWLLAMLWEHRVLTTFQIAQLAFGSVTTCAHRMHHLWWLRAVDRIQPFTPTGSAPMHYVLGDAGAAVLATRLGITIAQLGYRRDQAMAIFHSAILAHTTGTNGVFTALAARARVRPFCELAEWWPETRCASVWGDLARPDGYGRWREHDTETDFFLEYDTGTETIRQVAAKLPGYADLATVTGITTPVLFWFPTRKRETSARAAFTGTPVPIATTIGEGGTQPAGPVWLPIASNGPRIRLASLGHQHHGSTTEPSEQTPPQAAPGGPASRNWTPPVPPMPPGRETSTRK